MSENGQERCNALECTRDGFGQCVRPAGHDGGHVYGQYEKSMESPLNRMIAMSGRNR